MEISIILLKRTLRCSKQLFDWFWSFYETFWEGFHCLDCRLLSNYGSIQLFSKCVADIWKAIFFLIFSLWIHLQSCKLLPSWQQPAACPENDGLSRKFSAMTQWRTQPPSVLPLLLLLQQPIVDGFLRTCRSPCYKIFKIRCCNKMHMPTVRGNFYPSLIWIHLLLRSRQQNSDTICKSIIMKSYLSNCPQYTVQKSLQSWIDLSLSNEEHRQHHHDDFSRVLQGPSGFGIGLPWSWASRAHNLAFGFRQSSSWCNNLD